MKLTKSQLKRIINEELKEVLAHHPGSERSQIKGPKREPYYGGKLSPELQAAHDQEQAEKRAAHEADPDQKNVEAFKSIMRQFGDTITDLPGNDDHNRQLNRARQELRDEGVL